MHKNMDEGIRYILVGVLTTLVNYIFYGGFDFLFEKIGVASVISYKLAYGVAFVAAVLFAFFANKYMVFRKKGKAFSRDLVFLRSACGFRNCEFFSVSPFGGCTQAYTYDGVGFKLSHKSYRELYRQ